MIQGGAVLGTIITVSLALVTRDVWALVIGYVAEQGVLCLLSYVLAPYGPKLEIDRTCLGELWKFARGMFGLAILTMIAYMAPVLVLGWVDDITDGQVGMYSMAVQLVNVPILFFTRIIQPVMLPGLAGRQDDKAFLRRAILKITRGVAIFGIPLVAFVACFPNILLRLAWGSQYAAVAIPCAVLSLQIITRTEGIVLGTTYMAIGRPNLLRGFVALRAGMMMALIYPAVIHYGLLGAAASTALVNVTALLIQIFCCRRIMHLTFGSYGRSYIPGLLLALPVIATVGLLRLLGVDSAILAPVIGAFVLAGTFAAGVLVLSRPKRLSAITQKVADK
jgi:O-antigen/teichoic acid export membrane protein